MKAYHEELKVNKSFPLSVCHGKEKFIFPPHWHEQIEIFYVREGSCEVWINNVCYSLGKDEMVVIGSEDIHYYSGEQESDHMILLLDTSIIKNVYSDLIHLKSIKPDFVAGRKCSEAEDINNQVLQHMITIEKEYRDKKKGYKLQILAGLYSLIALLIRYSDMQYYSEVEKSQHNERISIMKDIYHYIENCYDQKITLEEVAKRSNFSVYYFTRFFKGVTGMTFLQYLHLFRIEKAKDYLRETDKQIIEVAHRCGFDNVKTFNRVFRKYSDVTPTEFRRVANKIKESNK